LTIHLIQFFVQMLFILSLDIFNHNIFILLFIKNLNKTNGQT
jgi:hypothetical protein